MSRNAEVTLTWADGDYTFRLDWGQLEALQEATDFGPWAVLQRLTTKTCFIGEISSVLRFGLIGGGMTPVEATKIIKRYVTDRPPMENLEPAIVVLMTALVGAVDEAPGELEAAKPVDETS